MAVLLLLEITSDDSFGLLDQSREPRDHGERFDINKRFDEGCRERHVKKWKVTRAKVKKTRKVKVP